MLRSDLINSLVCGSEGERKRERDREREGEREQERELEQEREKENVPLKRRVGPEIKKKNTAG